MKEVFKIRFGAQGYWTIETCAIRAKDFAGAYEWAVKKLATLVKLRPAAGPDVTIVMIEHIDTLEN